MKESANAILRALFDRYPALTVCRADITATAETLTACFAAGGKLLLCGNGGSAADCQHMVGELMKGFLLPRPLPEGDRAALPPALAAGLQGALPALSLCGETALLSACANDNGESLVFAQQVLGYGRPGDALFCLSTSGNSQNILNAARTARARGLTVLGLTGDGGGALYDLCDVCVRVPAQATYAVQEYHLPVYHALCAALEAEFFGV